MLDILEDKGPNAYSAFINTLQQNGYNHLVNLLENSDEPGVAAASPRCGRGSASAATGTSDSGQAENAQANHNALPNTVNITGNYNIIPIGVGSLTMNIHKHDK